MKKCIIICNPQSGTNNKEKLMERFINILAINNYETEVKYTKKQGDATKITKHIKECDLVIVAGGDGTLNEVLNGNLQRKKKLLIANLPLGTSNDVGKMYGYTNNYVKDLEMLLSGEIKNIDTCLINNRGFVYVAAFGNYVDVAYSTPRKLKKKVGKIAYFIHGFKRAKETLKTYKLTYTVDNKTVSGDYSFIFISNSSRIGGVNNIYPDVKLDDNKFEVAFCNLKKKTDIINALFKVVTSNKTKDIKGIEYYRTDKLSIKFDERPNESWCLDGEEFKETKTDINFSISKDISMLVPSRKVDKLFID